MMDYVEFPPPPDLSESVRCLWQLSGPGPGTAEPALPDGSPELIFSLGDPFEYVAPTGEITRQPEGFLVGQITRPMTVRPTGAMELVAVRFEAHGASLLHRPMAELTDTWVDIAAQPRTPLGGLLGALRSATDSATTHTLVWEMLRTLQRELEPPDPRVASAVAAIRASHGGVPLDTLAERLDCTPRTLQRGFLRDVGISPKRLARIVRFQLVFATWRDDPASLAQVAYDCGYSDQSHLARDFRDFAGAPPAGFLAAMPAFTELLLHGGPHLPV